MPEKDEISLIMKGNNSPSSKLRLLREQRSKKSVVCFKTSFSFLAHSLALVGLLLLTGCIGEDSGGVCGLGSGGGGVGVGGLGGGGGVGGVGVCGVGGAVVGGVGGGGVGSVGVSHPV